MDPEGGRPGEGQQVAIALAVALGHGQRGGVNRIEDGRVGVVHAEPEDAADLVRQPVAHLRHDDEARLLRRDGAFVQVLLPVHGEVHRAPAVGHFVGSRTGFLRHVHACALEMVAHGVLHVLHGELARGAHVERHRLLRCVAADERLVFLHVGAKLAEEGPHTSLASAQVLKIVRAVRIDEAEILVSAFEVPLLASEGDEVRRVHAILLVGKRDVMNARLISVPRDAVVGDADGHPHGAFAARPFADHFHDPDLVLVGYRERLSAAVVTVRSHKIGHHLDGLAGRA